MLSFGADRIFQSDGALPSDAELDAIIDRSAHSAASSSWSGAASSALASAAGEDASSSDAVAADISSSSSSSSSSMADVAAEEAGQGVQRSFSSGTSNALDFEAGTAAQSLRTFQGIEYLAKAATKTGVPYLLLFNTGFG